MTVAVAGASVQVLGLGGGPAEVLGKGLGLGCVCGIFKAPGRCKSTGSALNTHSLTFSLPSKDANSGSKLPILIGRALLRLCTPMIQPSGERTRPHLASPVSGSTGIARKCRR